MIEVAVAPPMPIPMPSPTERPREFDAESDCDKEGGSEDPVLVDTLEVRIRSEEIVEDMMSAKLVSDEGLEVDMPERIAALSMDHQVGDADSGEGTSDAAFTSPVLGSMKIPVPFVQQS